AIVNDMNGGGGRGLNSNSPNGNNDIPPDTREMLISENERIRSEMETLTEALQSLELKQNMALMTESIRAQEEIQSLRAVCHGLRMQMHYLLLDRQNMQNMQSMQNMQPPNAGGGGTGAVGSASRV